MREVVALCLGVAGMAVFTRLLYDKEINSAVWLIAVVAWAGLSLVAGAGVGRLESVVIEKTALRATLGQMQEAKADVFAKVEEVRRLTEIVAEQAVWTVRNTGRLVDEDHVLNMLGKRDEIAAMLRDASVAEDRVLAVVEPINATVAFDLRVRILDSFPQESGDPDAIQQKRMSLIQTDDPAKVEEYVLTLGNDSPALKAKRQERMSALQKFLKEKRL